MTFNIIPNSSAGPIRLGMRREEVRQLFETAPKSVVVDNVSMIETDVYNDVGVFIFYDIKYCCVAIEIYNPNIALFNSIDLLKLSFKEAKAFWKQNSQLQTDSVGYRSYEFGIAAYYESNKRPENIVVFSKGYYDN